MARRVDLFEKLPLLKRLVRLRSFQFLVILPNIVFFYIFLLAGIFGNPAGNQNIIIIFIWILWWFILITFMVPLGSRLWCIMCPLPAPGEWLQRKAIVKHNSGKLFGFNKPWPKRFRNIWLQDFGFLIMAIFSIFLVTRPIVSVIVIGGIGVVSFILMSIYRRRAFCVYLCPVSGFQGLYAMFASLELRPKDREVCRLHKGKKGCITGAGNEEKAYQGYPCPWFEYMGRMERNTYCGLCMECVKTCQKDNIALNLRPFGSDIRIKGLDEAYKSFIMLVLAMVYSLTLLGPYGLVKDWANFTVSGKLGGFLIYAGSIVSAALILFPLIYGLFVGWARKISGAKEISFKEMFIRFSYPFVPLGLFAWIAFSVPLIMVNGSYIISVISDPFGWGWNLLGTKNFPWTPFFPQAVPYVQTLILMGGLLYSIMKADDVAKSLFPDRSRALKSLGPITLFLLIVTAGFLFLFTA